MLDKIRSFLQQENLDALIIPRTDSFLREHYPPEKNQLFHATGFSGSAGLAIVTKNDAVLFVDSRYTTQAKQQSSLFRIFEIPTETMPADWMRKNLSGQKIGYPAAQRSVGWTYQMYRTLSEHNIRFQGISTATWENLFPKEGIQPPPDFEYDIIYAGESTTDKLKRVASIIQEKGWDAFIFCAPDSVSWLLNKRCLWAPHYPVIFKREIVWADGRYQELTNTTISELSGQNVGVDFNELPQDMYERLAPRAKLHNHSDIIAPLKAVKNPVEQENIRSACLFESIVICRFLAWVETNLNTIDEYDCNQKLRSLRAENPLYQGDSFDTIAAVGTHAALAHYQADKKSTVPLNSAAMTLIDTGGHYLNGTTDMTRTIATGVPSDIMKHRYTQVLKGHIALASSVLKQGDSGTILDERAHVFLRADGVDFRHATGHGIGMFLDVHEAPPVIYEKATQPLSAGMVFSNEPAFYDDVAGYGIRLENMLLTQEGPKDTIILENLLWIPFDHRLVETDLLTSEEKEWLKEYHTVIREKVLPNLSSVEQNVLRPQLDFFITME